MAANGHGSEASFEPVRVAVIGLGYWGPNLVRNLNELPEAEVVAMCDMNTTLLERLGRRYPGIRREADVEAVLADPTIEAVAIATPVGTHTGSRSRALEAGSTSSSRSRWRDRSKTRPTSSRSGEPGRVVMAGHTFLYSPPVNLIRDQIQNDESAPLLHLDEPGQPRSPPEGRQRRLGPRPARLLDSPLLARRDPIARLGDRPRAA